jgi:hypothetical protein
MRIPNWMRLSLEPDELIGEHKMRRWWILPANTWFNAYVHEHVSNDPRYLHDHPCDNISIRLAGELVEYTPRPSITGHTVYSPEQSEWVTFVGDHQLENSRSLPRVRIRKAEHAHRLELIGAHPAWTIWIRFKNRRQWGFFEPSGWRLARSRSQPDQTAT